jgi:taurine transport system permease protein
LIWLYYSWDIAKSFFPKSANELCQVGKVNESLLSLKYLFPIEERQLKSTSVIETETENLNKITIEIEKSAVKNQDKSKLINFISQTKNTIPLLTNEQLLNNDTREQIEIINEKIVNLTENFKRNDYPNESAEQEMERIDAFQDPSSLAASILSISCSALSLG